LTHVHLLKLQVHHQNQVQHQTQADSAADISKQYTANVFGAMNSRSYMIPGGWEGGGGVFSLYPPPEKSLAYTPLKKFGPKMGKSGQKMSFFGKFLTNPRDFHKSAVKFHEIL
jgi:hypothetical protein